MAVLHTLLDLTDEDAGEPDRPAVNPAPGVRAEWPVLGASGAEAVDAENIAPGFLQYYLANCRHAEYWPVLARAEDPADYPLSKVATHLKNMPLDKLSNTESKPFILDRRRDVFSLKEL